MSTGKRKYTKRSDYWNKGSTEKAALSPTQSATKEKNLVLSTEIGTIGLNSIKAFTNLCNRMKLASQKTSEHTKKWVKT